MWGMPGRVGRKGLVGGAKILEGDRAGPVMTHSVTEEGGGC